MSREDYRQLLENFVFDLIHEYNMKIVVNDTTYDCKKLHDAIQLHFSFSKFLKKKIEENLEGDKNDTN